MTNAYRYQDGALVRCEDVGHSFWEPLPVLDPAPFVDMYERRINVGIYSARAQSGDPPAWFKPNASRRARIATWSRKAERPTDPLAAAASDMQVFCAHRFRFAQPFGQCVDALLYLPQGQQTTEQHLRDMKVMVLHGARPVTVADVRAAIRPMLFDMAGDEAVLAAVERANEEMPYRRPDGIAFAVRVIEQRLIDGSGVGPLMAEHLRSA